MRKRIAVLLAVLLTALCSIASAQIQPTIRVYLRRLGVQDSLRVDVKGTYMLEDGSMYFADGTEMTVVLREGQLVLHTGGAAILMGASMKLLRCAGETPGALLLQGEDGLYEGDLSLTISDGVIRPILSIDVEDYLLGVVPFEMGDSFPLEALKAQAVAARTYALRKSGSSGDYDVEDTTNDQAYRGRTTYSPLSEQAVRETAGLCGSYKGQLAQCFYSASNGGQTELGQHVWPTSDPDAYGYMDMRDDPYDLENEASVVKRYTLEKKPGDKGVGPALHSALVLAMSEQLEALGYAAEDDLVRFDEITSLEAISPKFEGDSRLMTELRFGVRVSVREALFRDVQPTALPAHSDAQQAVNSTPSPAPSPTATPVYSPYTALDQELTVIPPIFTAAEQAMGLSINISKNELITVYDIGSAYMVESRRYGHGVGMSQRGAQQMASEHGMSYEQILSFYYPGMDLVTYSAQRTPQPTVDMLLMATPAPTPSPTPRPTLMPVSTQNMEEGAYLATVANIGEDSSLNLREAPSLSAEIKRRLYKDQELIVLSVNADGWAHVRTDVTDGYVRAEYLQTAEKQ
ncbi:MAG: SpoIID/LytB domain-containing protein [Clostridia bacterium]|nr:SpoIID/LytB domain-containing protein [Clostridia bacterium]